MRRFFGEVASAERFAGTERVWGPSGLWEADVVADLAEELSILIAIDPLAADPLTETGPALERHFARGRAYLRLEGIGRARPGSRRTSSRSFMKGSTISKRFG